MKLESSALLIFYTSTSPCFPENKTGLISIFTLKDDTRAYFRGMPYFDAVVAESIAPARINLGDKKRLIKPAQKKSSQFPLFNCLIDRVRKQHIRIIFVSSLFSLAKKEILRGWHTSHT